MKFFHSIVGWVVIIIMVFLHCITMRSTIFGSTWSLLEEYVLRFTCLYKLDSVYWYGFSTTVAQKTKLLVHISVGMTILYNFLEIT